MLTACTSTDEKPHDNNLSTVRQLTLTTFGLRDQGKLVRLNRYHNRFEFKDGMTVNNLNEVTRELQAIKKVLNVCISIN